MISSSKIYILFYSILLIVSCNKQDTIISPEELLNIPLHFPEIVFPDDNPFSNESWELGKMLFFDNALSADNSISCASCHKNQFAFADNNAVSTGIQNRAGTRNVPSLSNVAYHPYFTREGGVPSLEMQVFVPIQEHNEFDFNIIAAVERLENNSLYQELSQKAYGRNFDVFVLVRALANFERTLISSNSKYDQFIEGNYMLNEQELLGKELFFSERLACSSCHSGFDFTNYGFANNGLYLQYIDEGKYRFSNDSTDLALFKTPSLRNVELTAPYMHDGSFNTLDQVIDHYAQGIQLHQNLSEEIKEFEITTVEKAALISFLKTLTDRSFVSNPLFQNTSE